MLITPFEPIGARVTELAIDDLTAETVDELKQQLAIHGVLVLPDQEIDDADFLAFLEAFGEMTFTQGETPVPGFDDLNVVTNVGRTTPPRSSFHTDSSYLRRPPTYTALRAVEVPAEGGQTQFTSQYRALDTLPTETRDRLQGRNITHVVTGLDAEELDETSAEHPIFPVHPISGRQSLYMSTPGRCAAISGLDEAEASETIKDLYEHSTQEENFYRHSWSPHDVVIWDNFVVLHRADHSGVVGDRVMHRGMVVAAHS